MGIHNTRDFTNRNRRIRQSCPSDFIVTTKCSDLFRHFHWNSEIVPKQRIKAFQPEHLALEDDTEISGESMSYILHGQRSVEFVLH